MATIKMCTDIPQSEVLSKILPIESADMCYPLPCEEGDKPLLEQGGFGSTPCWSLAALLSVLPRFIEFKGDKYYLRFMKEYVEYANDEVSITGRCLHTTGNDNLVDACYEMIIHLHELNLL